MNRNFFSAVILSLTLPVMAFAEAPAVAAPVAPAAKSEQKAVLPRRHKAVVKSTVVKTPAASSAVADKPGSTATEAAPVAATPAVKAQPRKAPRAKHASVQKAARIQAPVVVSPVAK